MHARLKNKNNIIIVIGIILILLGSLLPSIRIAQENISFIKEKTFWKRVEEKGA